MKIRLNFFLILLLVAVFTSCQKSTDTIVKESAVTKKVVNPNGDSELALLMRDMYNEAVEVKKQIKNKEPIELSLDYEKILSAHATEPEKAASPEFKAFAKSYLQTIEAIKTAKSSEKLVHYNSMVNNCIACHKTLCPGPLVRIKKLQ